ncbi:hypothetical protein BC937DRAFT_87894 [Endogone sp. FLAS-F59071]|nr:hypothetical protein BC937DRAFT_87894 [Endogone sp. FLAS-F59071]|eukprot:RUS19179.1 hypothetical protein BC937DRAFT_87894 [Endogone sp. FLAS-F59071]
MERLQICLVFYDQPTPPLLLRIQYKRKIAEDAHNQRWSYREDGSLHLLADPNLVLDIRGDSDKEGSRIILYTRKATENLNQLWEIEPYGVAGERFGYSGQEGYTYSFTNSSYDI